MTGTAVFGVERSFTGRRWRPRLADDRIAFAIADRLSLPEAVCRVLAARGIAADDAQRFLNPTLRDLLPDPSHLRDMDRAAERIAAAVRAGEGIAIFGDYDVDGATSSALLLRFLRAAGARTSVYIPDRIAEGYGPNLAALLRLQREGARVVVTVDCGTTAFEALAGARDAGLDVIVVDHHVAEPALPAALAVVNPNRLDQETPHRTLAAVGVAFLLVVAVNRALRAQGWWASRPEPNLLAWLDLVALGTVCDVMPLVGLNRALVAQGLKVMARRGNAGLAALADVARLDERPQAFHLGYVLGPRVNAGGRVGRADLGARLLATDDPREAAEIAAELDRHNEERRRIEADVLAAATATVEGALASAGALDPVLALADAAWHPGVIGIVASRLKERFDRPAMVMAIEEGMAKGSGRSVPGFDLGAAVIAARQAGILTRGGGHTMAAGFALPADRIAEFAAFLCERFGACGEVAGRLPEIGLDGTLAVGALLPELVAELDTVGPYGTGMPEPRFALGHVRVALADPVGQSHVRCVLAAASGERVKAIAFRAMEGPLGPSLLAARGRTIHVAGRPSIDLWNGGRTVQIRIDDAAPAA
ncbi:MAG: single-stranded-DNA-specific exonuclease RecJ [Alphaproteobacteria bacterium]|nr:single-stranded-DNA-specific exonuclease RecJ [Alphaproteobacteria bacterium]